jgi:hypothetical protein
MNKHLRFCILTLGIAALLTGGCFGMSSELQRNGVSATATILEIWDTGWTVNDDPVIGMKVRVEPSDRQPYEAVVKHTEIGRLDIPQFQPGRTVPVVFDPKNPQDVEVDFSGSAPAPAAAASGDPYRDRYRAEPTGAAFLPPPATPAVYLGTADSARDTETLVENGYVPIGSAAADNASDPGPAVAEGQRVGAALVVLYGHFVSTGTPLEVLSLPRSNAASAPLDARTMSSVPALSTNQEYATYWGKTQRPVLGVYTRDLTDREKTQMKLRHGVVVDGVEAGSPAAAAHILQGDVIVEIAGHAVDNTNATRLISSVAGREVKVNLVRGGAPLTVDVQMGTAAGH